MNRKKVTNTLLIVLALLLVVGMAYQFTPNIAGLFSGNKTAGTPALSVNGQTVTVEELEQARRGNQILSSTDSGVLGDDFKTFVVANQVQKALVTASTGDIKVSRADINAEVTKVREANSLTDNKKWTDALQGLGLTDAAFRTQTRDQIAIQRRVDEIKKAAPAPTDAEAQLFYDLNPEAFQNDARIVAREIVVTDKAKAGALLAQARGGADFAALASANSTENKARGGALGPIENGAPRPVAQVALPAEVGAAAFALTGGGLTDVVASGGKFYIVKVEKFLPPAPKPFADAKTDVITTVKARKENAALETWLAGLEKDVKIDYTDPNWKTTNPTVATVAGKNIPYSDVVEAMVSNQQFASLLQQVPPEQAAGLVNGILKPQVTQGLIQSYAAPAVAEKLKLPLVGTRQDIAAGLAAYGGRDVKITDADLQAYYDQNKQQFQTPASASVSEASFRDRAQALAFRSDWKGGDFTQAAGKAGATVSERGAITAGDSKLTPDLEAAIFSAKTLKDAGEGSLSDVIKVGERFSVLYATDLKKAATQSLSAVKAQIESQVLTAKKNEAGQAFLSKQVEALKPSDKLSEVLAAQEKRVAAAAPKPTTPAPSAPAIPGTPGSAAPATTPPADAAPADSAAPAETTPAPTDSATPPATEGAPATPASP